MNLIDEQVGHCRFGVGSIIEQEEKIIMVKFPNEHGVKRFEYPLAFDKYLTFSNAKLQEKVRHEVLALTERIETERNDKEEEYQKLKEEEKIRNLALKKGAAKKTAATKSRTKKVAAKA